MVWLARLVPAAGLVVLVLLVPGAALAAAPTLTATAQSSGHLLARWSLPPGVETEQLVASTENVPDDDFGFETPEHSWDTTGGELSSDQTAFASPEVLDPGTYYVRVGGEDTNDPIETQWSNILSFVIPRPPPPQPEPGRYRGRTEFPDRRPVRFALSRDRRRIRGFRARLRLNCRQGLSVAGQFLAKPKFKPMRVRGGGRFRGRFVRRFRGGRIVVKVKGRLRPPRRASGSLTARVRLPFGVRCSFFPSRRMTWTARRR